MNKSYKFKLGDIIRCISNHSSDRYCKNKLGRIILIDRRDKVLPYVIEFFEFVSSGHDGWAYGKDGYCQWLEEANIELYKKPILKVFLKEKEIKK